MIRITSILFLHCVFSDDIIKSCPAINTIELSGTSNCPFQCPEHFVGKGNHCFGYLPNAPFDESQCPYVDYEDSIQCLRDEYVWYPAKRNFDYGIGEFMHTYYTKRGESVKIDVYEDAAILENNCVALFKFSLMAISCNEQFRRICVYEIIKLKMDWVRCSRLDFACISASYNYSELKCLCPKIRSRVCAEANTCNGDEQYCLYGLDYDRPSIFIEIRATYIHVQLTSVLNFAQINNINLLCYSDYFANKLFGTFSTHYVSDSFKFPIFETGAYWCSGYDIKYYEEIISNKVIYIVNNLYVIEVTFNYNLEEDPTSSKIAYSEYIKKIEMDYNKNNHYNLRTLAEITVKWMKTLWVDVEKKRVTYLIHICTNNDPGQHLDEYNQINRNLYQTLESIHGFSNASELYSYEYCIKSVANVNGTLLTWKTTERNKEVPSLETYNNRKITRKCIEDFYIGARWEILDGTSNANDTNNNNETNTATPDNITEELNELLNSNDTVEIIESLCQITQDTSGFTPNDMLLISSILLKLDTNECDVKNISNILSNIMMSDVETLLKSQKEFNATDRILDSYDRILEAQKRNHSNKIITSNHLYTYIFDGTSENVGFGLLKSKHYETVLINRRMSIKDIANIPNLEAATYIPHDILENLNQDSKITITIHLTPSLFNSKDRTKNSGKNFGILLPKNIKKRYNIPILFTPSTRSPNKCGFWDYGYELKGSWKLEKKPRILPNNLQVCYFPHVTHFGLLILDDLKLNNDYLELITNIGTGFSLFGFSGVFLTAALFKIWRQNRGNQILINYSAVSFIQFVLLYSSSAIQKIVNFSLCVATGAALHYTLLSQFCWMLVIAFLQYKRYVEVLHGHQRWILAKAYLTSYIFPVIPVIILLVVFEDSHIKSKVGLCFPSGDGLFYCVLIPIALVVLTNFLIFVRISLEMFCIRKNKCIDDDMFLLRLRLVILMYFMLGVTWGFGLAANILESKISFYIFCITGSLQGFIIFLFFIVFNENSRLMYIYMWKKYSC